MASVESPPDSVLLAPLRCRSAESGYRNVYRHKRGWVAKVKRGGRLMMLRGSASPNPREAARHVAAWYAREYGPQWAELFRRRQRRDGRAVVVSHSKLFGGFFAVAWVCGVRTPVEHLARLPRRFGRDRWTPTGRLAVFPTAGEARANVRRYLARVWGVFAECVLWR